MSLERVTEKEENGLILRLESQESTIIPAGQEVVFEKGVMSAGFQDVRGCFQELIQHVSSTHYIRTPRPVSLTLFA